MTSPEGIPDDDASLVRAIEAARSRLGPADPTTRQLVARRTSLLIRLGRDAEAAALGAAADRILGGNEGAHDD